jgi:hypothetical protein
MFNVAVPKTPRIARAPPHFQHRQWAWLKSSRQRPNTQPELYPIRISKRFACIMNVIALPGDSAQPYPSHILFVSLFFNCANVCLIGHVVAVGEPVQS